MKFTPEEKEQIQTAFQRFSPPPEIWIENEDDEPDYDITEGGCYATIAPDREDGFSIAKDEMGHFMLLECGFPNDYNDYFVTLRAVLEEGVKLYRNTIASKGPSADPS